ncbi:MAG: hypothetical protein IH874_07670 [Candidatus Dadabacteria bacterium]|nr:hypothetical protein [Candidatus Dadabacteria bacterium]
MRRNLSFIIFCNLILLAATFISSSAAKEDFAGSSDHPLIGRYEGSWIGGYKFSEFDEYNVVTGKITTKGENALAIEGKVTTIAYHIPNDVSVLQFYRNYKSKILDTGFNVIFECKSGEECGRNFSNTFDIMPIPKMWGGR